MLNFHVAWTSNNSVDEGGGLRTCNAGIDIHVATLIPFRPDRLTS